jgi:hypothetical protein
LSWIKPQYCRKKDGRSKEGRERGREGEREKGRMKFLMLLLLLLLFILELANVFPESHMASILGLSCTCSEAATDNG